MIKILPVEDERRSVTVEEMYPIGDRIIVRPDKKADMTEGGLHRVELQKERISVGTVVKTCKTALAHDPPIEEGDRIVWGYQLESNIHGHENLVCVRVPHEGVVVFKKRVRLETEEEFNLRREAERAAHAMVKEKAEYRAKMKRDMGMCDHYVMVGANTVFCRLPAAHLSSEHGANHELENV